MIWLKLLHVTTISVWSAGLICLPGLYLQRAHVPDEASLHRLQALVRFLYVAIVSPAAFLAIASGTGLIFLSGSFEAWFSLKLALVGLMTCAHILSGLVVIRLFDEGEIYPTWRFGAATGGVVVLVTAILATVLAKPDLPDLTPQAMSEPGALRAIILRLNPFPRS